jgi:hypothetical protein
MTTKCKPTVDVPPVQSHWHMLCIFSRPLMHPHTHHHHTVAAALLMVSAGVTGRASRPPVSGPLSPNTGHCCAGLALSRAPVQQSSCGRMTALRRCRQACWLPLLPGVLGASTASSTLIDLNPRYRQVEVVVVLWWCGDSTRLFQRVCSTIWTSTNEASKQCCITLCS